MKRRLCSARFVPIVLACLLDPTFAFADDKTDRIKSLEERLESNQRLIEQLQRRVEELERSTRQAKEPVAAAPAASSPVAATAPAKTAAETEQARAISDLRNSIDQISEGLSKRSSDTGLPVHGFADIGAAYSSKEDPQRLRGFNVGTFELYLTPQFGSRVKSLFELAFEIDEGGHAEFELERLQLGYAFNDALTLWGGRFHTPFGLWNTSFHHGANLQTSIFRPRFIDFEDKGGIIPAHSVGLWASGKTALGPGKITYDAYVSNGPRVRERMLDFNAFTDDNPGKMLGLNVGYQPSGALHGLSVGLHGFGSTVDVHANDSTVLSRTRLRMYGGYAGYDASDWEVIGEYYRFDNTDDRSGTSHRSSAWFLQVGRTFGSITPYARYERTSLDPADAYFASQSTGRSYRRAVVGARYAVDGRSSFKFELSSTRESAADLIDGNGLLVPFAGGSYRRAALQYSIAF